MMREIKFRAWLGGEQGMLNWDGVRKLHLATIAGCKHPMQYTGLKDKNGNEIYEGDIISTVPDWDEDSTPTVYKIVFDALGHSGTMGFHAVGVDDGELYDYYGGIPYDEDFVIEVIGNIYENPELIKEGKE